MGWLQDWKSEPEHAERYREFGEYAASMGFCWACGRSSSFRDKPTDFYAPWLIHRAHIVNKPRICDRRVTILLCPICHACYDSSATGPTEITLANAVFLKQLFDPAYFDVDILAKCSIRRIPPATDLSDFYRVQFQRRRGEREPI